MARILYNLVDNASKHSADRRVQLVARDAGDRLIQIVVSNAVDEDQAAWLSGVARDGRLGTLFDRGVTRGGRGIGLHNAAAFVAAAFGLSEAEEAVEGGHVGAVLVDRTIHVWFHWPAVGRFH